MQVTSKGQVTIPKDMREQLGIGAGSSVVFSVVDDHLEIRVDDARPSRGRRVVAAMRGAAGPGMSTDEIMALTRADD